MNAEERFDAIDALVEVWPRWRMEAGLQVDCCILAAKLAIPVLDYFGVTARPEPVQVMVHNPAVVAWRETHDQEIPSPAQQDKIGGWTIGITPHQTPTKLTSLGRPGWSGHIVLYAANPGAMIDLTIDQCSRPARDIKLKPRWFITPFDALARTAETGRWMESSQNGSTVAYQHLPGVTSYQDTLDWRSGGNGRTVGSLIRAVRSRMEVLA